MPNKRLLAIDPSLTASGWAVFCLREEQPVAVGVISPPGPRVNLELRLSHLQAAVESLLSTQELREGDYLVCEGPAPLVKNPLSALKVERVRSIFETIARARGLIVPGRLNPRTVQTELLGMRGKQLARKEVKQWAKSCVERLYGVKLVALTEQAQMRRASQDVIDALLIGTLAASRIKFAINSGSAVETVFASTQTLQSNRHTRVKWTTNEFKKVSGK